MQVYRYIIPNILAIAIAVSLACITISKPNISGREFLVAYLTVMISSMLILGYRITHKIIMVDIHSKKYHFFVVLCMVLSIIANFYFAFDSIVRSDDTTKPPTTTAEMIVLFVSTFICAGVFFLHCVKIYYLLFNKNST